MDEEAKSTSLNQISYGLYVIGSKGQDDMNGMTANWLTQLSFDPPMVGVAIEKDSHTRKLIDEGKVFSVNIVEDNEEGRAIIEHYVKPQKPYRDKLGDQQFSTGVTGTPLLAAAVSWFECQVENSLDTGSHILYIGRVVGAGVQKPEAKVLTLAALGWHYGG